jgi:NADH-quinone oxidoreductase subunit A
MGMAAAVLPVFLFIACALALAGVLLLLARLCNPSRPGRVKEMPYESGMDPIHDTRRQFGVRFHLLAIAFLVFDVELLFLYPWAAAARPYPQTALEDAASRTPPELRDPLPGPLAPQGIDAAVAAGLVENRHLVFGGAMIFIALLIAGFVYDWRKGIFQWR